MGHRGSYLWLVALAAFAGCQSLENRLVFHPAQADSTAPLPAHTEDVDLCTADGTKVHARWYPHPNGNGVLLYCHGNAGNLEQRDGLMRQFAASLGRSVLIFDYPGFGRSDGKPSEAGCYASAEMAFDWLTRRGIPEDRIVIAGESLGGGVAVELACKRPHQALVLIRTFTSIPDVAKQSLSSAPLLMVNRFNSIERIGACKSPVFIAQADQDRLIPFSHAEQLRDACRVPVQVYVLRGLDHNDPLPPAFFTALRDFLAARRPE